MPFPISIAITAFNEEANIARCLKSAADLAEEIVVVDSGSTDRTKEIAGEFGAQVIHQAWLGHSRQKQAALNHCTKEWVLVLDCDEELSPELRASMADFFKSDACRRIDGAWFNPRHIAAVAPQPFRTHEGMCEVHMVGSKVIVGMSADDFMEKLDKAIRQIGEAL